MPPSPERAHGWIATLLPLFREGGPVLTLMLALLLGGAVYYLLGALDRSRQTSVDLLGKLLACQEAKVELARHCAP